MCAIPQFGETGDVIGVKVCIDGFNKPEVQFPQ
jgi:hypothetical protein